MISSSPGRPSRRKTTRKKKHAAFPCRRRDPHATLARKRYPSYQASPALVPRMAGTRNHGLVTAFVVYTVVCVCVCVCLCVSTTADTSVVHDPPLVDCVVCFPQLFVVGPVFLPWYRDFLPASLSLPTTATSLQGFPACGPSAQPSGSLLNPNLPACDLELFQPTLAPPKVKKKKKP